MFNARQLKMGIKVEKEHAKTVANIKKGTKNPFKQIAMDHLKEIPDYYTRLSKMEKSAKKKR